MIEAFMNIRKAQASWKNRLLILSVIITSFFSILTPTATNAANPTPIPIPANRELFADGNFFANWQRTDFPVSELKASRSWYWGPKPSSIGVFEDYTESFGGKRLVQYFDKARMEINDALKPTVTNGLLVVELITGRLQKGDNTFEQRDGASIPIAGDPDNNWPTYAGLKRAYNSALGLPVGATVQLAYNKDGTSAFNTYVNDPQTKIAAIQNKLSIPAAFWTFLNRAGSVYKDGNYSDEVVSNWLFSTGYPIGEAYWTKVKVAGQLKDVMFQPFERRLLTYTPANPEGFKVEMGNVGSHYVSWRYNGKIPETPLSPALAMFAAPQPEWYLVTGDGINVRVGPGTTFSNPPATSTLPYLSTLYQGNRIQVLNKVKGEKLVGDNDVWFQFYKDPDMYVYSGYVQKMVLPDMPTPPRIYSGPWISVNLEKQMMAVYDGPRQVYRTLIASGRPNTADPANDHSTPKGTYKIDGSYRPATQTMENTTSDKAAPDYYKLDQIRDVSYFYQDYAIHGTYWHARFGTVPQSHGCVNATTYDASLIYQLKAGTTVDVF